jgi:predicted ABC-type sugar transport system permease subunit
MVELRRFELMAIARSKSLLASAPSRSRRPGIAGIVQASQVHTATTTYGVGIELDVIGSVVLGGASLTGGAGSIS